MDLKERNTPLKKIELRPQPLHVPVCSAADRGVSVVSINTVITSTKEEEKLGQKE